MAMNIWLKEPRPADPVLVEWLEKCKAVQEGRSEAGDALLAQPTRKYVRRQQRYVRGQGIVLPPRSTKFGGEHWGTE